jgi:hypothetical protein
VKIGLRADFVETLMPKTIAKIKLEKEKLRLRERAPIRPSRLFEDKRRRGERHAKHKKDLRRLIEEQ